VIALFVCAAVYLNWNYSKEADAGKTLGQSAMVGNQAKDPLVKGDGSTQTGTSAGDNTGDTSTAGDAQPGEPVFQQLNLRTFSAAVDALKYDK